MSSAYIKALQRCLKPEEPATQLSISNLEARFLSWLDSQPEISRLRPYAMSELEKVLGTQGRYLSTILLRHGWTRGRKWTGNTQYLRYWVPPGV